MAAAYDAHGTASWPGAIGIEGCTYTISHGISPGIALLRMHPQDAPIAPFGTLILSDGNEDVVLPDCRVQSIKQEMDDKGFFWAVEIQDRRWRWKEFGYINGCYNQMDPFGKLIPWTIRSPRELAILCLAALGEDSYFLDLPAGINNPGPFYPNPVINVSGVNPPVNWEGIPPAQALQEVADRCGCRIIYQWSTDRILVAPIGDGQSLPPGSVAKRLPTITPPKAPSGVGVIGSPTRYQCRLALTAVGKEWDGSYRPINLLSYAPLLPGAVQKNRVTFTASKVQNGIEYKATLTDDKGEPWTLAYTAQSNTVLTAMLGLALVINESAAAIWQNVTANFPDQDNSFVIQGKKEGFSFKLSVDAINASDPWPGAISQEMIQAPVKANIGWDYSMPPLFANVRATNRLTQVDAQRLAQESVFRCYQLSGVDVWDSGAPNIPGYGRVLRTQQILLQDTQVDQIVPAPDDSTVLLSSVSVLPPDAKNVNSVKIPLTVNFYNGYAHDKPAAVYGQIAQNLILDQVWYPSALGNLNTDHGTQVMVPFSVEPEFFLIRFGQPIFMLNVDGTVSIPDLTLQTAVLIRDPDNNQLIAFTRIRELAGGDPATPPAMRHYPDVQANVTSSYDDYDRLQSWALLEQDPIVRAEHYLNALANEYQWKAGESVEYNGIRAIDLDAGTWQITWSVGGEGCSTVVSQNAEHSIWVPPYPARRRAEFLPPVTRLDKDGTRINMV